MISTPMMWGKAMRGSLECLMHFNKIPGKPRLWTGSGHRLWHGYCSSCPWCSSLLDLWSVGAHSSSLLYLLQSISLLCYDHLADPSISKNKIQILLSFSAPSLVPFGHLITYRLFALDLMRCSYLPIFILDLNVGCRVIFKLLSTQDDAVRNSSLGAIIHPLQRKFTCAFSRACAKWFEQQTRRQNRQEVPRRPNKIVVSLSVAGSQNIFFVDGIHFMSEFLATAKSELIINDWWMWLMINHLKPYTSLTRDSVPQVQYLVCSFFRLYQISSSQYVVLLWHVARISTFVI